MSAKVFQRLKKQVWLTYYNKRNAPERDEFTKMWLRVFRRKCKIVRYRINQDVYELEWKRDRMY